MEDDMSEDDLTSEALPCRMRKGFPINPEAR